MELVFNKRLDSDQLVKASRSQTGVGYCHTQVLLYLTHDWPTCRDIDLLFSGGNHFGRFAPDVAGVIDLTEEPQSYHHNHHYHVFRL